MIERSRVKISLPAACNQEHLYGYDVALNLGYPCYVAAELDAAVIGRNGYRFYLGDGKAYGEFENKKPSYPSVMAAVGVVISHVSRSFDCISHCSSYSSLIHFCMKSHYTADP